MNEYFTPPTLLDDVLDELREAREMVAYLTRANEALTAQIDVLELDARSKETAIPVNLEDL
jgi:hypothetical protein